MPPGWQILHWSARGLPGWQSMQCWLTKLALCGLALGAGGQDYVQQAGESYRAARAITSAAGIVGRALRLFDALAVVDEAGILAGVRDAIAGEG